MNTKLLKAAAWALVLVFGSMGGVVWAAAGSQPGSPLYPVRMAVEKMGLTTTADEVTETEPGMEFVQEQVDEMQQLADDAQGGTWPNGNCDPVKDRRDGCAGGDCDEGFAQRVNAVIPDHESDCLSSNCDPPKDCERDGTCGGYESSCPGGNCGSGDHDGGGGHRDGSHKDDGQSGGGHH